MTRYDNTFYYDETSPSCLRWNIDKYGGIHKSIVKAKKNDIAGGRVGNQYWRVRFDSKKLFVHRIIWEIFYGEIPENMFIDHLDGDRLNNKISNLRLVTRKGNARNASKQPTKSGLIGVTLLNNGCGNSYWRAHYRDLEGNLVQKCFSIDKLGNDVALQLAVDFRLLKMNELNNRGAGYTDRHLFGELNEHYN